ncbi:hypothetical protein PFJ02_24230 [Mycobacterium xenopi]|uniref:hypothetical protein n=1 Tax=Mycobacterium xenopi TaxID=1789 RepID=UPI0022EAB426|nr:hypothetical protein [Mycobacterium xenopi]MDA3665067.1 hypothetical protein [Mycobacterium xenopi]
MTVNVLLLPDKFSVPSLHEIVCDLPLPPRLSLNPWMGDFVLPSTRLFWDAAECGAVGRG